MHRSRYLLLVLLSDIGLSGARAQGARRGAKPAAPVPYQAVDARMRQVPDSSARTVNGLARFITASFATEDDRARAAFGWVARNIRYDVENMYRLDYAPDRPNQAQETLDKRHGMCQQYAELYSALANQAGVLTYVVPGYTRQSGFVAHAWCASRIAGHWWLLDPTWAAGYVKDGHFVAQFDPSLFRVAPDSFIHSHMPFDPLWQLLPAPRTPQQFHESTHPAPGLPPFAFADSVAAYARQGPEEQLRAAARRVAQNGVKNDLIYNYLLDARRLESTRFLTAYNGAIEAFNAATQEFNTFISFFNRQFSPRKTDEELRQLLMPMAAHLARARTLLAGARPVVPAHQASLLEFQASLEQLETKLHDGQSFVERYQHTNKLLRLMLFGNPAATGSLTRSR